MNKKLLLQEKVVDFINSTGLPLDDAFDVLAKKAGVTRYTIRRIYYWHYKRGPHWEDASKVMWVLSPSGDK